MFLINNLPFILNTIIQRNQVSCQIYYELAPLPFLLMELSIIYLELEWLRVQSTKKVLRTKSQFFGFQTIYSITTKNGLLLIMDSVSLLHLKNFNLIRAKIWPRECSQV